MTGESQRKETNPSYSNRLLLSPGNRLPFTSAARQLRGVMEAAQISRKILLNQMSKSSAYYCDLIDTDKCRADAGVNMIKKPAEKLLIMLLLIKLPGHPRSANKGERSRTHINSPSLQPTGGREGGGELQRLQRVAFDMNTKIAFVIHTDFTIIY